MGDGFPGWGNLSRLWTGFSAKAQDRASDWGKDFRRRQKHPPFGQADLGKHQASGPIGGKISLGVDGESLERPPNGPCGEEEVSGVARQGLEVVHGLVVGKAFDVEAAAVDGEAAGPGLADADHEEDEDDGCDFGGVAQEDAEEQEDAAGDFEGSDELCQVGGPFWGEDFVCGDGLRHRHVLTKLRDARVDPHVCHVKTGDGGDGIEDL